MKVRVVVVSSIALSMFQSLQHITLRINRIPLSMLPDAVAGAVERLMSLGFQGVEFMHYIRHPATLELVRKYLPIPPEPNSGLYAYRPGDVIIAVSLKTPQRGQEVAQVSEEDLDVAVVEVL